MPLKIRNVTSFEDPEEQEEEIDFEEKEIEEEEIDFEEEEIEEEEIDFEEEEIEEEEIDFEEEEMEKKKRRKKNKYKIWLETKQTLRLQAILIQRQELKQGIELYNFIPRTMEVTKMPLKITNVTSFEDPEEQEEEIDFEEEEIDFEEEEIDFEEEKEYWIKLGRDMRLAEPRARVLIQRPKFRMKRKRKKRYDELRKFEFVCQKQKDMNALCRIEDYICKIYVEKTGQSYDIIQQDLKRTRLMSAKEAQHYGIIDRIMTVDNILLLEENLVPVGIEFTSLFIN
ncbi:hypothetical protein RHGRI_038788 [Rhododendron griersonianum]|uniref:ATP-dependent Clp protease proteolytic subunit n=1 Tax=Rhododendron griersonianum TaxID=479676 RepID=A0AAV6HNV8_9ERIC|nr:hypothetical protein RHGRI_038788 [Rhododendron griersonianum]